MKKNEPVVQEFVAQQKRELVTNGIVICGSYAQDRYGPGSDIDIVFLTAADGPVEVAHVTYRDIPFHRLIAPPERLYRFLVEATEDPFAIAVLHSLATDVIVVEPSAALTQLICQAQGLVSERGIAFDPEDRNAIILQGQRYRITKEDGRWKLVPVAKT